jgi:hypothetical protein
MVDRRSAADFGDLVFGSGLHVIVVAPHVYASKENQL